RSGIDPEPDDGAHSAGKFDGQRSQPWTDLEDIVRCLELQCRDNPLQLAPIGDEVLSPASLKANAKAAGNPSNDRRVREIEGTLTRRRGSTERDRWRFAASPRRSRPPWSRAAPRFAQPSRRARAARPASRPGSAGEGTATR